MKEAFGFGLGVGTIAAIVGLIVLLGIGLHANADSQSRQTDTRCAEYDKAVAQIAESYPSDAVIFAKDRYYVC